MSELITADEVRAGLEDVSPLELLGDELLSLDVDELRALCVELDADQLAIVERAISYMTGNGWRSDPLTMAEYLTRAEPVNGTRQLHRPPVRQPRDVLNVAY